MMIAGARMTLTLCFGVFATVACAGSTLRCDMALKGSDGGWVAPEIYISHEPGSKDAKVLDGIIQHFSGGAVAARVSTDNKVRTTYVWDVKTKDSTKQRATIQYRLTVQKASQAAQLTAAVLGYRNQYTSQGQCKPA